MFAGTVKGKVNWKGDSVKPAPIKMNSDDYCLKYYEGKAAPVFDGTVVNPNGTVPWVFVYVTDEVKGNFPTPAQDVEIDQEGCEYHPHVLGVMENQALVARNSDKTKHNFHLLGANRYNRSAGPGKEVKRKLKKAGKLALKKGKSRVMSKIKCDIHPWMSAYVAVMPHPFFAVTGPDGTFEIKGLPAGKYTLAAWHEKFGTVTQKISVNGGAAEANFAFDDK